MRALIATNHLFDIGGSEIVALEMAKYLTHRGFTVDVYANTFRDLMSSYFALPEIGLINNPAKVRPFTYDFVYIQHQVAGLFNYKENKEDIESSIFVFGRLSRRTFLESGGWAHDNALGDISFANSELTAERLSETGIEHDVLTFYNAAPAEYFLNGHHIYLGLKRY